MKWYEQRTKKKCRLLHWINSISSFDSDLQGLLEKIALGMCFWRSSVRYFGNEHLGRTFDGPVMVYLMSDLRDHSRIIYMRVKVLEQQQAVNKCICFNLVEIVWSQNATWAKYLINLLYYCILQSQLDHHVYFGTKKE